MSAHCGLDVSPVELALALEAAADDAGAEETVLVDTQTSSEEEDELTFPPDGAVVGALVGAAVVGFALEGAAPPPVDPPAAVPSLTVMSALPLLK